MKKIFFLSCMAIVLSIGAHAQAKADSLAAVKTFRALLEAVKAGDAVKASANILNTNPDSKKAYKAFANYSDPGDKLAVDKWIKIIRRDILGAQQYSITAYESNKESEGVWHMLMLSCTGNEKTYTIGVAFLKVGNRLGLGDID
jgi:hypothetical protein